MIHRFIVFLIFFTIPWIHHGTLAEDFKSFCSHHGHGNKSMTSIALKTNPQGLLISHEPSTPFRRTVCAWRLMFDKIEELDDLVPAPRNAKVLLAPPDGNYGPAFAMRSDPSDDFSVRLDFIDFDIAENLESSGSDDDVTRRCSRNFVKVSYVDAHANKDVLGVFCGRVTIPKFIGDPERSVMIEVELNDAPRSGFSIRYSASKLSDSRKLCADSEIACSDKRCVPDSYRCDKFGDCPDGSDESRCHREKPPSTIDDIEDVPTKQSVDSGCKSPRYQEGPSGSIQSLNFPEKYPNNLRCIWYIETSPGMKIRVSFNATFNVEASEKLEDCPFDSLTFYEREGASIQLSQQHCGRKAPSTFLANANWVLVVFETDSSTGGAGFHFTWTAVDPLQEFLQTGRAPSPPKDKNTKGYSEDSCTAANGIVVNDVAGVIQSPGYGSTPSYPSSTMCRWRIRPIPPKGGEQNLTKIVFRILDFSVSASDVCAADFVMIRYTNHQNKMEWYRFCNDVSVPPFEEGITVETSTGADFIFRADSWLEERGFEIAFQAVFDKKPSYDTAEVVPLAEQCGISTVAHAPALPAYPSSSPFENAGIVVAEKDSFPWMVELAFMKSHICAGTLIAEQWIVTAARCFSGQRRQSKGWELMAGTSGNIPLVVENIFVHQKFGKGRHHDRDFDVGLIKLREKINLGPNVMPLCLASRDIKSTDRCYTIGWHESKMSFGRPALKQVHVPIVENTNCRHRHLLYDSLLTDNMLCAGYEIGSPKFCYGNLDGGSTLACYVGNKWELHGILSWGKGCSGSRAPDVYTRIYAMAGWIQKVMQKFS